jgi:diguanylate cyclase (GGDEF)-like protein/PAS domain S-box-containing protein
MFSELADTSSDMRKILFDSQLTAIFFCTAVFMTTYEFLKEIYFKGTLSMWESHLITICVTASLATAASFFVRKWAVDVNEQLGIAAVAFESQEGMLVTDENQRILRVNRAFTNITGYTSKEVVGKNPRILSSGRQDASFYAEMWRKILRTDGWEGEIWNRRKNGEIYPEYLTITAVRDSKGDIKHYVGTLTDITSSKAAAEEVQHLAFYDQLTRLPNRRLLTDRLGQALATSERSGRDGAVLFIDLDNFKALNDTLGHDIGDLLLQQVAQRLESCVRVGDTVARLGGDEFVIVLEELSAQRFEAAAQVESIGEKILTALNQPYQLASHKYISTPSVGATLFNDHQQGIEELMKQADIAMYQAKKSGRNALRFFDPVMQDAINIRIDLERDLRNALKLGQFQLYYQMQVDNAGHPTGAEALIRWLHPVRGIVSPLNFIPLAEETNLILSIGEWVLDAACAQIKQWEQNAETSKLSLSVNVSAKQFRQADFVEQVLTTVKRHDINPARLKLELTESMLVENIHEIVLTMNALKAFGIQFSLDDFGTGYSSLQYLKMLPLNQLKIDQSFVRDIATDNSDRAIVLTIITMARSLGLDVIAEGVETESQRQFLVDNGCLNYQGYLFSKPLPIGEFECLSHR